MISLTMSKTAEFCQISTKITRIKHHISSFLFLAGGGRGIIKDLEFFFGGGWKGDCQRCESHIL
jgi:hypothetical protein